MIPVLSVENMRKSDAATIAAGTSGRELMGRAGKAIYEAVPRWDGPVALVCGKGNNGGDGFVTAALLKADGIACTVIIPGEEFTPDAEYWYGQCRAAGVPAALWQDVETLEGYATVADCIFGTGFRGSARGEAARMIRLINSSGAYVVSVDINSGLDGDSGMADDPELAVHSDITVSVGSFQPGHFLNMAKDLMKSRINCPIGIEPAERPYMLTEAKDISRIYPPRPNMSNKGTWGTIALIGGSLRYSGSVRLAAMACAAMRCGAGIVRLAAPETLCRQIIPDVLESTLFPLAERDGGIHFREEEFSELIRGVRSAAFGMGAGNTEETGKALDFLLRGFEGTLIIDADGLNAAAAAGAEILDDAACRVILTPHPGEFARLTGRSIREVQRESIPLAMEFAARHHVTVLLKGTATVVTDGTEALISDRGCPGMATAGSGDVLSGVIAAVCSQPSVSSGSVSTVQAAAAAAWIAGRAGELAQERFGEVSMTAGDTAAEIPQVFSELTQL